MLFAHAVPFEFNINVVVWGMLVRMSQAALHAAPTIVVGILVAAVFRSVLGREKTLRVFGGYSWRQIPQAWGMGMLLPVCSLGAIPIMSELRRAGLVGGTIIAFGLTAPIFNPVSVLYGLSLSRPLLIFIICACSLAIVTLVGLLWDRFFPNEKNVGELSIVFPYGWKRIVGVLLTMSRIAWSRDTLWILIGVVGVGLLSSFLAPGALQNWAEYKDPWAPVRMATISMPAYMTPMDAMVQLSNMFQHGNSIAAAFTLLILGTGLNLGVLAWSLSTFRWWKSFVWLGMTTVLVVGIGYAIDRPLYPAGIVPDGHTHAYDNFCLPILENNGEIAQRAWQMSFGDAPRFEWAGLACWLILLVGGAVLRRLDPQSSWEQRLAVVSTIKEATNNKARDIVLPGKLVGALSIIGLLAFSVVGCFVYYPPAASVLRDLSAVNAETCARAMTGDTQGALHWIPVYEDQLKKLEVGMYLRGQELSSEQSSAVHQLEETLEDLEHAMKDRHIRYGRETASRLADQYTQFRWLMN